MERDYLKDFDLMIRTSIEIGNKLGGQKIPQDNQTIYFAEGLAQKIINHIVTARHLFDGYKLRTGNIEYAPKVDFCSIVVLTRAALETYLAFNYVFVAGGDEDVKKFRFLCWHLGGFMDRSDFNTTNEAHIKLKENEKAMAEKVKQEILSNTIFQQLPEGNKKRILSGTWRIHQWHELATMAGFNERFFRQQYEFLCSHAHSSRLSVIQVQQNKTIAEQREMAVASMAVLMVVLAKYMYDYIEIIPQLHYAKNEQEVYSRIVVWKTIGERI